MDAINDADHDVAQIGQRMILPSSFTGSDRQMSQIYQDAMAIVRKFGRPDLFVTFTCNPKWPEITVELEPGQSSQDRPDLVARVFHLKMQGLMKDLLSVRSLKQLLEKYGQLSLKSGVFHMLIYFSFLTMD